MENYKVCKFGGTSLADKEQMEKVIDIITKDPSRRYIVVSAPGKRNPSDTKITDQLIALYEGKAKVDDVTLRFLQIMPTERELVEDLDKELKKRVGTKDLELIKAFGEYASGRVFTQLIKNKGIEAIFADPAAEGFKVINDAGYVRPNPASYEQFGKNLIEHEGIVVIPGFYGLSDDRRILTLPRGGSDTTGAVVANAINASVYENWTDEDGLRRADPRIVPNSQIIREMTFQEARELAYMGFKLQEESMIPVSQKNIPINIRNTNNPNEFGTLIVSDRVVGDGEVITGVACKKPYLSMNISKMFMNSEIGFGRKVFQILEGYGIPYEHSPTGIDSMSVLIHQGYFKKPGLLNNLKKQIMSELGPLELEVEDNFALISVVGIGMKYCPDADIRILTALKNAGIDRRMLNEGAKDLSLFIGVNEEQSEQAVRAIYREFFK